jgi:DNA gyrase/topoisomerase IV subunit A
MGERSGVGLVELAVLEALDSLGARPGRGHRKNATVLAAVEDHIGLAPGYAYEVLLDLARPWTMPLSLIDGHGNFGSRGDHPAANPRYTESRLSAAGQVALAAERADIAPVPIGLINGNIYARGTRPPFRPQAVIDALRQVIQQPRVTSTDLIDLIGPPYFLNGCTVTGDFAALAAGRPTEVRLQARISISDDHASVRIENLPPNANPDETTLSLANRGRAHNWAARHPGLHKLAQLPLRDIRDQSSERQGDLIICVPARGTTAEQLAELLRDVYGVYTTVPVALPRPLPALLRSWARACPAEDLLASLAALEDSAARGRAVMTAAWRGDLAEP